MGFDDVEDFGEMEFGVGGIADGDDGAGVKSGSRDEVVVRWGRIVLRAEGAKVDNCALKTTS